MQFFYFIREAIRSLVQAKMVTVVSIMTVAITLFFLTLTHLAVQNVERWFHQFENRPTVVVYFDLDLSEREEIELSQKIAMVSGVDSTHFVSRSDAQALFVELHGKELLSSVDGNIFPASVEISPADTVSMTALEENLTAFEGVESVAVARDLLKSMNRIRHYFTVGAALLAAIMVFALYFTITNTIKLTVYARQELVRNMQFVGASRWYIRFPFVLEGMIQGVTGAFIAWIGVAILTLLTRSFPIYWGGVYLFPITLLLGALLGTAGSLSAVRRFVK